MEIKHYNAIAKIIGGNLIGDNKLGMLINSLSQYFEEEDESFNKHEFRAACLNGSYMEENEETDTTHVEKEITPIKVEKTPYTWKTTKSSGIERIHEEWIAAMKRMPEMVSKNFKKRSQ